MRISNTMRITVKATLPNNREFPWSEGVRVDLQGDNSLDNIISELKEVKAMINKDANKHGFSLAAVDIEVTL